MGATYPIAFFRLSSIFDFGTASGTPLGVMSCDYAEDRIQLAPNDIVLLMTDGLADALEFHLKQLSCKARAPRPPANEQLPEATLFEPPATIA